MMMAFGFISSSTSQAIYSAFETTSHFLQSGRTEYEEFLDQSLIHTPTNSTPLAQIYSTTKTNNEVYNLTEILKQPDKDNFVKAMHKEVASMFEDNIWKIVPRSEMLEHYATERRKGVTIKRQQLMMIWSFKRKRDPEGNITKHKARLCCHGGQQEWGVNYWNTYSPVVSWSSIRILMTLSNLHNFHTKSVDFVQAFPQAKVKSTIFLKTPDGVELSGGTKQS